MLRFRLLTLILLSCLTSHLAVAQHAASSQLERALQDMYTACLFANSGQFSNAVELANFSLAPGITAFIEDNLAAIPLAPPNLEAEFLDGQIVTTTTGFAPIFTESSSTVGKGKVFIGSNVSFFNLSRIRGRELSEIELAFQQDGGGDVIRVNMPLDVDATVFTLYGTFGVSERLDLGISLPFVRLRTESAPTTFEILGSNTGLLYGGFSRTVDYTFAGSNVLIDLPDVDPLVQRPEDLAPVPDIEAYLSTIALRGKYRVSNGIAALVDLRLPMTRSDENVLGKSNLGVRVMMIGEYALGNGFKPYVNLGGQFWEGDDSNSLKVALGFNQRIASRVFFAFDVLGEMELEANGLLNDIDEDAPAPLVLSNIRALDRDHTLNAGLGMQVAATDYLHLFGSAMFSLLDSGLQSTVAPTFGLALYY